jgi:glucose/arabinose dehydrogenase
MFDLRPRTDITRDWVRVGSLVGVLLSANLTPGIADEAAGALALRVPPQEVASVPLTDPIPEPIGRSGLAVVITDYLALPATSESTPRARINQLRFAPNETHRFFVNDLRGRLYVVEGGGYATYLDVAAEMSFMEEAPGLGSGFGSFAFHPDFATNGLLYTVHTEHPGRVPPDLTGPSTVDPIMQGVITEWRTQTPDSSSFSGTRREVLRVEFPGTIHGMQEIAFNPGSAPGSADYGLMYVGVGDGGSIVVEVFDNSGRLDSVLGTILRIDPTGTDGVNGRYGIPTDNPWVGDGDPSTLGEIWAFGFRNPHRFSWDTGGEGTMLIGEIGEANIEEINVGIAGADYGFPRHEGTFAFDPTRPASVFARRDDRGTTAVTDPVAQYDHDEGSAVTGGFVYRGERIPELVGHYVFGDIPSGRIFHFAMSDLAGPLPVTVRELTLTTPNGLAASLRTLTNRRRTDVRFGLDPEGELFVMTKVDGVVRRLVGPSPTVTVLPTPSGRFDDSWFSDGSGTWTVSDDETLTLRVAGTPAGPIRRPAAIALLRDYAFGDVSLEAEIRSTADASTIEADMLFVFGYQSPTRFYYVHLSGVTNQNHNGIFVVDGADRRRLSDLTSTPQLADRDWHRARLERDATSGRIAVYMDGAEEPGLVAFDKTFGSGSVGFGSFDDTGEIRRVVVRGALHRTGR